jgi:hypothetical protein
MKLGRRMTAALRTTAVIFSLLLALISPGARAQSSFDEWQSVPQDMSALIVKFAEMKGKTLLISDAKGDKLDAITWESDLPFLKRYLVPAGSYEIDLPSTAGLPANKTSVELKAGTSTLMEINPIDGSPIGTVAFSSWGQDVATTALFTKSLIEAGYSESVAPSVDLGKYEGNVLSFSTDPPFSIPPPPKN